MRRIYIALLVSGAVLYSTYIVHLFRIGFTTPLYIHLDFNAIDDWSHRLVAFQQTTRTSLLTLGS